jgi:CHASE2 domain-containing sensor protein
MSSVTRTSRVFDVSRLREKPRAYWLRVLAVTLAGMVAMLALARVEWWRVWSASSYGRLQQFNIRQLSTPHDTAVVVIDDAAHRSTFGGRVPLRRDQLAALIEQVASFEPRSIGLDIELSAADSKALDERETEVLWRTLTDVGARIPLVLATTLEVDVSGRQLVRGKDAFADLAGTGRITAGYTRIPHDSRCIPLQLEVNSARGTERVDSLALALAKTRNRARVPVSEPGQALPFGRFLSETAFAEARLTPADLSDAARAREILAGRVVLIGGSWTTRDGARVDEQLTPAGRMPGVFVHANYVEALLGQYMAHHVPDVVAIALELLFGFSIAFIFIGGVRYWKFILLALLVLAPLPLSVMSLQNFGIYLDGLSLIVLIGAHATLEEILERREERHHARGGVHASRARKILWEGTLLAAIAVLGTIYYVRHHGPASHSDETATQAAMLGRGSRKVATSSSSAAPSVAVTSAVAQASAPPAMSPPEPGPRVVETAPTAAVARHERAKPEPLAAQQRGMVARTVAAIEDALVEDLAEQFPANAAVRSAPCVLPDVSAFEHRSVAKGVAVRIAPDIEDEALLRLLAAVRRNGARMDVILLEQANADAASASARAEQAEAIAGWIDAERMPLMRHEMQPTVGDIASAPLVQLLIRCAQ